MGASLLLDLFDSFSGEFQAPDMVDIAAFLGLEPLTDLSFYLFFGNQEGHSFCNPLKRRTPCLEIFLGKEKTSPTWVFFTIRPTFMEHPFADLFICPFVHQYLLALAISEYKLEDILIVAIVESEDEFVEIDLKVLCGDAMVDSDDRSLEQAPEVLHAHCMDVAVDECLGMTDGFMPSTTSGLSIALEFIGNEQFSADTNEGIKERGERIGFEVLDLPLGTVSAVYLTFTAYQGRCAHCGTIQEDFAVKVPSMQLRIALI